MIKFFNNKKERIHGDVVSVASQLISENRFEIQPISVFGCGKVRKLRINNVIILGIKNPKYHFHHRIGGGFVLDEYGLCKLVEKRFIRNDGLFIKLVNNKQKCKKQQLQVKPKYN